MQPFSADDTANPGKPGRFAPALKGLADEISATAARLIAYVGVLALIAILGVHGWGLMQDGLAAELVDSTGWAMADRPALATALVVAKAPDQSGKPDSYATLRDSGDGAAEASLRLRGAL